MNRRTEHDEKRKNRLKISAVQAAPVVGNKEENLRIIEEYTVREKAELIIFPELFLTGYLCKDELPRLGITLHGWEIKRLEDISRSTGSYIIVGAPVTTERGELFNSALLIGPEGYIGRYDKFHLPNFLPFEESIFFTEGKKIPVFDTDIGRIGMLICYDIFFPEVVQALSLQGAQIVVNISASPSISRDFFETLTPARAVENTVFYIYTNLVGTEERLTFWGGNTIVSPKGFIITKGKYFEEQAVSATIDLREIKSARLGRPVLRDKRREAFEILKGLL